MTVKKKSVFAFAAVALAVLVLAVTALSLMSSTNLLTKARRNCDTITINAEYNSVAKTLDVVQNVRYENRTEVTLTGIKFHIYANAYRDGAKFSPVTSNEVPKAYPSGKSFGNISVGSVKVGGAAVGVFIEGEDENVLSVPLITPLRPGKNVSIDLTYTIKLANIKHRLGWTDNAVNLGNFYPVPVIFEDGAWQTYPYSHNGDPFYNALHNFNVTMKCDRDLVVASSGTLVSTDEQGLKSVYAFKSSAIRDFAMVLSKNFENVTKVVDKITVNYFYLDDSDPQQSLRTAVDSIKTFSRLFTKYPYKQLSVVQTDFLHGGMEYGELVYIALDVLTGDGDNEPSRSSHNQVIIHEIAHQWWYGITGNNQVHTAWIDEGLAEYSTLLFYDHNPQYKVETKRLIANARDNYSFYVKLINTLGAEVDPEMNKDLNTFRTSYDYVFMTYVRGMLLFADLEKLLGQSLLTRGLREFARETSFGFATQDKLVKSLERTTRFKLQLFFDSFLSGNN